MRFLPIVARELREAGRRRGTYWIRVGTAAVGLLAGGWVMLLSHRQSPHDMGVAMFVTLAIATYFYSLFIGVIRTADCLSEEKREGTLGLLFLTDLKGYDIVLGKLVASSINACYGMLALFPIMAIPLLLGGVTVQEFGRVALVATNTMIFSMAVGMFASAVSRDERRAVALAISVLLLFAGGFPFLCAILQDCGVSRPSAELWLIPSPGYAAVMAFEVMATVGSPNHFVHSVVFTQVLSWLLLAGASWIVPRTWQDRVLDPAAGARRRQQAAMEAVSGHPRRVSRQRWLDLNPIFWLVSRRQSKFISIWIVLGLGAACWAAGLLLEPLSWKTDEAYIWTSVLAHLALKFWLGTEAVRRFCLDRQSGAMELLVSTPLPVHEIVRGQVMGLERQFAGPALLVLGVDFVFMMAGSRSTDWVIVWVAWMVMLVADLLALTWLGMWRGLNSRRPMRAAAAAFVRVLVLPWVLFGALATLVALGSSVSRTFDWDSNLFVLFWALIGLGIDAGFGIPAHRRLLAEFRTVVAGRFDQRGSA
jgi:ABC-type transport system involved in cytochrome c biogenesis permease component